MLLRWQSFFVLLGLVKQLFYLLGLLLEAYKSDLFATDGARVLLLNPLRNALFVEEVCFTWEDHH